MTERRLTPVSTRARIARRSGSLLMIVGGLVLAYPFWSAAYTHFAQEQLAKSYRAESSHFATQVERRKSTLAPAADAATRLRSLAALFAASLKPGDPVGHMIIPRLGMNRVILQGVGGSAGLTPGGDAPYLRSGPVHYGTTPLPGAGEPFAIAGHRTTFAAPFYNLNELRRGDQIFVDTPYARFTYTVSKLTTVLPTDVTVLYDRGYGLVLTTCTPRYSASHRLIAWALLTGFRFQQ
jgi:sortase A